MEVADEFTLTANVNSASGIERVESHLDDDEDGVPDETRDNIRMVDFTLTTAEAIRSDDVDTTAYYDIAVHKAILLGFLDELSYELHDAAGTAAGTMAGTATARKGSAADNYPRGETTGVSRRHASTLSLSLRHGRWRHQPGALLR